MAQPIFRLSHRKTVEEATTVNRIVELLFMDDNDNIDPSLSLYLVNADGITVTRIIAEHSAFSEIDPPARAAVDLYGLVTEELLTRDNDGGCFRLRKMSHYVIKTSDGMGHGNRGFYENIANSLLSDINGRLWSSSSPQIKEYGRRGYSARDPEWVESANSCDIVMKWVSKVLDPNNKDHKKKLDPDFVKALLH